MTTTSDTFHPNMSSTPDYLYQLTDVERTYYLGDHKVEALKGVNLTFREGEFATIQGPTGGGKSTLLQLLGGLDRPTTGTVMLRDINLGQAPSSALTKIRAEQIGFVFQSFNLLQTLTASQNVDVALEGRGLSKAERAERVTYALHRVGLAERADHRQGELSGGQQQRVAIARAIVATPSLLLADEPTGNLDEAMRDEILVLLEELNREGLTIIAVTHDSAVAARAHRQITLGKGRIHTDSSFR